MDLSSAPALLADLDAGVLFRSVVIAAVLVTPYGLYKRRQVLALRAEAYAREHPEVPPAGPVRPRLEDVIDGFTRAAAEARASGEVTITVPGDVTVDGKDAPVDLVDVLVRDGLRRSGLVPVTQSDSAAGRTIECRPATTDP